MRRTLLATAILSGTLLAACQNENGDGAPGTSPEGFDGIAATETVNFTGTEPFWGGSVSGERLTYQTPEEIDGSTIQVRRFTGQGGLGYSGTLDRRPFDMTITPGECLDGMSDRAYPYTVTLKIGEDTRFGCAWTDTQPFEGPDAP
ncbi:COG3650 family protein [Alteriqipengyuania lutimaris]|uniref:Lipoprotein n=1 Tax=Alteriqipengyuania lutimaris TaxID=1538146 RepID=A0A395LH33_9SPHN|nr:hypothetical protein [Alteriqipengyuania lutimaris]MBB3034964.1 putative membrane protein [Alteriqipengyuania lutimaris]RDS76216.1 hypothetical protein DL238_00345 [Alteriqipengyuania lutimaris]